MNDPYSGFYFIYILAAPASEVELFNPVFPIGRNLICIRNNAHIYIPVFPLMLLTEQAFANPQYRSFKATQVVSGPKTDGNEAALLIAIGFR